jgi:hypothetical protein
MAVEIALDLPIVEATKPLACHIAAWAGDGTFDEPWPRLAATDYRTTLLFPLSSVT